MCVASTSSGSVTIAIGMLCECGADRISFIGGGISERGARLPLTISSSLLTASGHKNPRVTTRQT